MKQFTLAFSAFTFLCPAVFAQDATSERIIVTCPQDSKQVVCNGTSCTATFSIDLPSQKVISHQTGSVAIFQAPKKTIVKFSTSSAQFGEDSNGQETLTCMMRRDEIGEKGQPSQFIEFSASIININSTLKSEGYIITKCKEPTAFGVSCNVKKVNS